MKWCDQCGHDVGYVERQVAADPHGLEYYELECEECGAALGLVAVEIEPSTPDLTAARRLLDKRGRILGFTSADEAKP